MKILIFFSFFVLIIDCIKLSASPLSLPITDTRFTSCVRGKEEAVLINISGATNPDTSLYYQANFFWKISMSPYEEGSIWYHVTARGYTRNPRGTLIDEGACLYNGPLPEWVYSTYTTSDIDPQYTLTQTKTSAMCRGTKAVTTGSFIDYDEKSVVESIPIDGTGFSLNYNSAYNPNFAKNKRLDISYAVSDQVAQKPGRFLSFKDDNGGIVRPPLAVAFTDNKFNYTYIWDGQTAVLSDNGILKEAGIHLLLYFDVALDNISSPDVSTNCTYTTELSDPNDPNSEPVQIEVCAPLEHIYVPEKAETRQLTQYRAEVWGLGGWTLSVQHYFDVNSKILFSGRINGKIQYAGYQHVTDPNYGEVNLVIDKDNGQYIYIFDMLGRHLETRHATMGYTIYKFNYAADNRLLSVTDQFGKQTQFVYGPDNSISKIISPYGVETNLTMQNGLLTQVQNSLGKSHGMVYDEKRFLLSFTDLSGEQTQLSYNGEGELLSEAKNTGIVQSFYETASDGVRTLVHTINSSFKESFVQELLGGGVASKKLDGNDQEVQQSTSSEDSWSNTIASPYYSETADFTSTLTPIWGRDYLANKIVTYRSEESGQQINYTDTFTENRSYSDSNPLNILSSSVYEVDQSSSNIYSTTTVDNVNKVIIYDRADDHDSYIYYNNKGLVTRVESFVGLPVDYTYNENGQLTRQSRGADFITYGYDQHGYLSTVTNSQNQATTYIRDSQGKVTTQIMPNSEQIQYEYSDGGELKKIITSSGAVHNFNLSLGDYVSQYLDPDNNNTQYNYDDLKRLKNVIKPSGKNVTYNYESGTGNLAGIETSEGNYSFSYDLVGRTIETHSPDQIKTKTNWVMDRPQHVEWYDTDGSLIGSLDLNYTGDYRLESIYLNSTVLVNNFFYDSLGRLTSIGGGGKYSYNISRDEYHAFTISSLSNTLNSTTIYSGNEETGESSVSSSTTTRLSNGDWMYITMNKSLDINNQVRDYTTTFFNNDYGTVTNISELEPVYDANDRLVGVQKSHRDYVNGELIKNIDYYNNYIYNLNSNNNINEFTQKHTQGDVINQRRTVASFSPDDRLLSLHGSINRNYTYTADGEIRTMTNCYGTTSYEYDSMGNLKKVVLTDGRVIEYKVDAYNRRIKKLINGATKEYYLWYDQTHLFAVLDENKQFKQVYTYGPESAISPAYVATPTTVAKLVLDPLLGSVRYAIVNSDIRNTNLQEIEYDEYGNMLKNTDPDFQPLGFAGGLYDYDTKLYRFGARDYDPTIGRWLSKDPIGFAGGDTNLYAYVGGNPMSYNDPTGLFTIEVGGGFLGQAGLFGGGAGKNIAFSFNFSTGQWQTGTTTSVQVNVGGGLYGGAGGQVSITPGAGSLCDLKGNSYGVGGAAGTGIAGASGQITFGSAGPTFTGSVPMTGVGAGVAGYGTVTNTTVQVTNQGNLYNWLRSAVGF